MSTHRHAMLPEGYLALRIAIVDDVAYARSLLRSVLFHVGLRDIIECGSREEGFDAVCYKHPDLVITDWDMPGGSGLDLLADIRRNPASPDPMLPVILLTAHGDPMLVRRGRDAGATDFLVKPFTPISIARRVEELVQRQRSFVSASGISASGYLGPDRRRAMRPVAVERRGAAGSPVATIIPPDGLLSAIVSGSTSAIVQARARRLSSVAALASPPDRRDVVWLGGAPSVMAVAGASELAFLVDKAMASRSEWHQVLPEMAAPLTDLLHALGDRIPAPLMRVSRLFLRFATDAAQAPPHQKLGETLLAAIRAMLLIGAEHSSERTAIDLAEQAERLAARDPVAATFAEAT